MIYWWREYSVLIGWNSKLPCCAIALFVKGELQLRFVLDPFGTAMVFRHETTKETKLTKWDSAVCVYVCACYVLCVNCELVHVWFVLVVCIMCMCLYTCLFVFVCNVCLWEFMCVWIYVLCVVYTMCVCKSVCLCVYECVFMYMYVCNFMSYI